MWFLVNSGSGAQLQRGPGRSPGGVRGRAPVGCGAEPRKENFAFLQHESPKYRAHNMHRRDATAQQQPALALRYRAQSSSFQPRSHFSASAFWSRTADSKQLCESSEKKCWESPNRGERFTTFSNLMPASLIILLTTRVLTCDRVGQ
eukprot:5384409-Prymnesium_polylepis.1